MQRTRLDHGEVGLQRAHVLHVFDPAYQMRECREVLEDDRSTIAVRFARHHDVHGIPLKLRLLVMPGRGDGKVTVFVLLHLGKKQIGILDQVRADFSDIGLDHRGARKGRHDFSDRVLDSALYHLGVQFAHLAPSGALVFRHLLHDAFKVALNLLDIRLDRFLLVLRQLFELWWRNDIAILHRRNGEAHRGPQNGRAQVGGTLVECVQGCLLLLRIGLQDCLKPGLVLVALEQRRDIVCQVIDQILHRLFQAHSDARRQAQRPWLVRHLEIVDVDPVIRNRPAAGVPRQQIAHDRVPARSRRALHEDVEIPEPGAGGKLDGVNGTILAERSRRRRQVCRRCEVELRRIEDRAQHRGRQRLRDRRILGHAYVLRSGCLRLLRHASMDIDRDQFPGPRTPKLHGRLIHGEQAGHIDRQDQDRIDARAKHPRRAAQQQSNDIHRRDHQTGK